MANKTLSRRDFLRISAAATATTALAGVTGLAGAAPMPQAEEIEILEWAFANNRIIWQEAVVEQFFKEQYPNVTLTIENIPYNDLWDKLQAVFVAGSGGPDMADIAIHVWRRFARGEVPFWALDDRIGDEKDNLVDGSALAPWRANGEVYGVGNEVNTVLMYYREDLLSEMGLDGAAPQTWEELAAMGEEIMAAGDRKLICMPDNTADYLEQMLVQRGGNFFDEEGNPVANSDLSAETLAFQQDIVNRGIAMLSPGGDPYTEQYYAAMKEGAFLFQMGAPWYQGFMKNNNPELEGMWRMRLLPTWGDGVGHLSVQHGGTGMAITNQARENTLEPAWELIRQCNLTNEGALLGFTLQNLVPTYTPAWEDPSFLQLQDPYFGDQLPAEWNFKAAEDMVVANSNPDWQIMVETLIRLAVAPVLVEGANAQESLNAAVEEFEFQR